MTVTRFYLPALDGLRFVAFLAVFVAHAGPKGLSRVSWLGPLGPALDVVTSAGLFGVDLFFVLSAYLITGLLLREAEARGQINIGAFYLRRALRIWPLYYVALALTVFVVPHLITDDFPFAHAIAFALFAGNWSTVVLGGPDSVAAPLWSVSVEEQFYLVWPLFLLIFGVRRIPQIAFGALTVAFATRAALLLAGGSHDFWNNTFTRLDPIALGALVAVATRRRLPALASLARGTLAAGGALLWIAMAYGVPGAVAGS